MILEKCPHCGTTVQIRHDEDHKLLDPSNNGSWSIWHGNYDGGCPGRFVHHMWFLTEEAASSNWNAYCKAHCDSDKSVSEYIKNDIVETERAYNSIKKKTKQIYRAWLYEIKDNNLIVYDGYIYQERICYAPVTGLSKQTAFLRSHFKGIKKNRRCATTKETIYENCLWLEHRDDERAKILFKAQILNIIYFHSQQMSILEQRLENIKVNEIKVIQ